MKMKVNKKSQETPKTKPAQKEEPKTKTVPKTAPKTKGTPKTKDTPKEKLVPKTKSVGTSKQKKPNTQPKTTPNQAELIDKMSLRKVQKSGYISIPKEKRIYFGVEAGRLYRVSHFDNQKIVYKAIAGECVVTRNTEEEVIQTSLGPVSKSAYEEIKRAMPEVTKSLIQEQKDLKERDKVRKTTRRRKLPTTVKITKSGCIIIPLLIRTQLGIHQDHFKLSISEGGDTITLTKVTSSCSVCGSKEDKLYSVGNKGHYICNVCASEILRNEWEIKELASKAKRTKK